MTLLAYSHTLVAGTPENINDVQDMFNDVKNVMNGNLDDTNLATSSKRTAVLGPYKTVGEGMSYAGSGASAGTYWFTTIGNLAPSGVATAALPFVIPVTPADFAVSGLTTQFRVRAAMAINATAPGVNFTFGLFPIASIGGSANINFTLGAALAGSTVTRSAPTAGNAPLDASSDFTISTPGLYLPGVTLSGSTAANSFSVMMVQLQVHNV